MMKIKAAHTIGRKLLACKTTFKTYSSIVAVVLLLYIPVSVFADNRACETVAPRKPAKIVYAAGEGDAVVITEGRITAACGHSIKLLPGTHLKGEQPTKASIVSRERQEELAYEAEQQRKQEFFTTLFERLKETKPTVEGVKIGGSHIPLPGGGTSLLQWTFFTAVLPVQPSNSYTTPAVGLNNQLTLQNIHNLRVTAFKSFYLPLASWGNQSGNRKVMLC